MFFFICLFFLLGFSQTFSKSSTTWHIPVLYSQTAREKQTFSTTSHTSKIIGCNCSFDNTNSVFAIKTAFPKVSPAFLLHPTSPLFCRKLSEERPEVMLNQFPCENLLTVKDCLASISRRAGGPDGPRWLPRTFNLQTELPQFISYFQQRDRRWLVFLLPYIFCFLDPAFLKDQ